MKPPKAKPKIAKELGPEEPRYSGYHKRYGTPYFLKLAPLTIPNRMAQVKRTRWFFLMCSKSNWKGKKKKILLNLSRKLMRLFFTSAV